MRAFKSICASCFQIVKFVPVAFLCIVIFWSYFAYNIAYSFYVLADHLEQQILLGLAYHAVLIMFLWAFMRSILARPLPLPAEFRPDLPTSRALIDCVTNDGPPAAPVPSPPPPTHHYSAGIADMTASDDVISTQNRSDDAKNMAGAADLSENEILRSLIEKRGILAESQPASSSSPTRHPPHCSGFMLQCRNSDGSFRFCRICFTLKPDRAHHCSSCDTCILRMDHHCPWINNCVGAHNHKFFFLFLFYALLYCLLIFSSTASYFLEFWRSPSHSHSANSSSSKPPLSSFVQFNAIFLFFISAIFALALFFLFAFQCYLLATNQTTLETFKIPILWDSFSSESMGGASNVSSLRLVMRLVERTPVPGGGGGGGRSVAIRQRRRRPFNLGSVCANLRAVLGPHPLYAWLPCDTHMEGVNFPVVGAVKKVREQRQLENAELENGRHEVVSSRKWLLSNHGNGESLQEEEPDVMQKIEVEGNYDYDESEKKTQQLLL